MVKTPFSLGFSKPVKNIRSRNIKVDAGSSRNTEVYQGPEMVKKKSGLRLGEQRNPSL
jgi:hypothetical protein